MPYRYTMERKLRDDDDATGQTLREWCIKVNDGQVLIMPNEYDDGHIHGNPLRMRISDVPQFVEDLQSIADAYLKNPEESKST